MLHPSFLNGVDEQLAWRLITLARSIAPGIDTVEGDDFDAVIAILQGVATEATSRGSRFIASQRVGTASVNYWPDVSWFSEDDKASLRSLAKSGAGTTGPVGSFPAPSRVISHLWPERDRF